MKYASIALVVLVILGIGGVYLYSQNQNSDSMMKRDEAAMMESSDSMEKTDAMMEKNDTSMEGSDSMMEGDEKMDGDKMMSFGTYAPFTQSAFDRAKDSKRVIFFFANWCPTCKPIDTELTANTAKIPAGVEIFRVNYNDTETDATDKDLAAKYAVTYQHTFVQVDAEGNEVTKWNGGGLDKIVSMVK